MAKKFVDGALNNAQWLVQVDHASTSVNSEDEAVGGGDQPEPMVVEAAEEKLPIVPEVVVEERFGAEGEEQRQSAGADPKEDEQDQEMNTADAENEEPMDLNSSPVTKKSRGLPTRAISTPQNSQLPDVCFADFIH